jgi:hypothetical protein
VADHEEKADSAAEKVDLEAEILVREKCTKQYALSAARNAKFLSSQQKAGLYFAKSAIRKRNNSRSFCTFFFYFLTVFSNSYILAEK